MSARRPRSHNSLKGMVMATEHPSESLKSVFWYAKKFARHPEVELRDCVLLQLGGGDRSSEYHSIYHRA